MVKNMKVIEDTSFTVSLEGDILAVHHEEAGEIARIEGDFSGKDEEDVIDEVDLDEHDDDLLDGDEVDRLSEIPDQEEVEEALDELRDEEES